VQFVPQLAYYAFLDRNTPPAVIDPSAPSTPINVTQEAVQPACSLITHLATFRTTSSQELHLRFGPTSDPKVRAIFEIPN
jgi:hypothetical protein